MNLKFNNLFALCIALSLLKWVDAVFLENKKINPGDNDQGGIAH
jgi:hypothetical protein